MAIRPVSSLNLTNGLNQVNFGRKRKNASENSDKSRMTVPHKLAVPLAATVLAMSPLSSASASSLKMSELDSPNKIEMVDVPNTLESDGATVVASKTFPSYRGPKAEIVTPKITLLNTKGGSGFDKIVYSEGVSEDGKHVFDMDYKVSALTKATYSLVGDDGVKSNPLTFYDMEMIDEKSMLKTKLYHNLSDDMRDYLVSVLKSSDNNTDIKVNNYNLGLRQTLFSLQNVSNGDILKDAQPYENFGEFVGTDSLTTKNGSYKVNCYSRDDNPDDVELVTVKKAGYPELQLKGIYTNEAYFNKDSDNPQHIKYGSVFLLGKNKEGKTQYYFLLDDQLTMALVSVFTNNVFANAAKHIGACDNVNYYSVSPSNKYVLPKDGE